MQTKPDVREKRKADFDLLARTVKLKKTHPEWESKGFGLY
jgi:hypothetical protein